MRLTLDLPQDLLEEARARLGLESDTATVGFALRDLFRRQRVEDLTSLVGEVDLDVDVAGSRRRTA